jgi:L-ascorbate metabolism protein UlaG (beta-lactamase superfamily)
MKLTLFLIAFLGLCLSSCITIRKSSLNLPEGQIIERDNVTLSSTGPIFMNILGLIKTDFLSSGIKIVSGQTLIYADPVVVQDTSKSDIILVTHSHLDHFSKKTISRLSGVSTLVVGPKTITKKLKKRNTQTAQIGEIIKHGDIQIEVVESYNLQSSMHKKGSNFLGYVISVGEERIYIAGDTDLIPEMKDLKNISIAILPIGEGKTAMNPQTAAEAVRLIRPELVIPVHYELGKGREEAFRNCLGDSTQVEFFFPVK